AGGLDVAGGPAAETAVRATPAVMPAVIPAAPPTSDRKLGRRMGCLLVGFVVEGTGPTGTPGRRLSNEIVKTELRHPTKRGIGGEMAIDERIQALLEQGEELGCLNLSAVSEFLQE